MLRIKNNLFLFVIGYGFFGQIIGGCSQKEINQFDFWVSFSKIESIRGKNPVNFNEIEVVYNSTLRDFVASLSSHLNDSILSAIQKGKQREKINVQSQIISKSLQLVFSHSIHILLNGDQSQFSSNELAQLADMYECLSPTVVRRSQWAGKSREMDDQARSYIKNISKVRKRTQVENEIIGLKNVLKNTYALSIFYELVGIQKNRGANWEVVEEKQVEAQIFLKILELEFSGDKIELDSLKSFLKVPPADMDIPTGKNRLKKLFPNINFDF